MKKQLRRLLAAVCTAALLSSAASALTVPQALELLEESYVDELPAAAYEAETLDELFQVLGDPYTYYMSTEEYQAFLDSVNGASGVGVGVAIQYTDAGILITRILPGGTAEEAGLVAGDTIVAIDGSTCVPAQENDVSRITGEEGTEVTLEVLRADGSRQTFRLERRSFSVPTVEVGLLESGQGYIKCDSFGDTTGDVLVEGLQTYDSETDLWLADVRSNPGGLISAAQDTVGAFTGPAFVAWLRDANGRYSYSVAVDEAQTENPAVVLTNGYSASASEIFASAMKDLGAGIVVGGRTYGKGVAQIVRDESTDPDLFDGDALKITAYRFYSPAMNTTDCVGTLPTLLLSDDQTNGVALLLRTQEPDQPAGWMRLTLNGLTFYVDVAAAKEEETSSAALSALFAALPVTVPVEVYQSEGWTQLPIPWAAALLEVEYTSRGFTDVADSPYAAELDLMATYGLLNGVGDGTYQPDKTLTRAELCAMLCHVLNRVSAGSANFSDVPVDAWYAPYVAKIAEMGLVTGKGYGIFDPNGLVTQQELVTVLGRTAAFLNANCYELLAEEEKVNFADYGLDAYDEWAKPYAWLLGNGYPENVDNGGYILFYDYPENIQPRANVTRAEAGAALCTLLVGLGILSY